MDVLLDSEKETLLGIIINIGRLASTETESPELIESLLTLKQECDKSIPHKVAATSYGAYSTLLTILEYFYDDKSITHPALETMISLMTGNPDPLNQTGTCLILAYMDTQEDMGTQQQTFYWARECCIKNEMNRQEFIASEVVLQLKKFLKREPMFAAVIRSVCRFTRALVLDDDVRADFGDSSERTRIIANQTLCAITALLNKFEGDEDTLSELVKTLIVLVGRNELCDKVNEAGGVRFIINIMINFPESKVLNHQCFKILKGLAGNDHVKANIIKEGAAPILINSLNTHRSSTEVVVIGCSTLAALSLRSPENSRALCNAGAPEAILEIMKTHPSNETVQKQCCWAVRNIVSRDRSLCEQFLKLDAEALINNVLQMHRKRCDYDAKAALRDLGCNVDMREG